MALRKGLWIVIISLMVILSGCGSAKEIQSYFDDVRDKAVKKNEKLGKETQEMLNAVVDKKPEDAVNILNEKIIPSSQSVVDLLNKADVSDDDLVRINDMSLEVAEFNVDKRKQLKKIFTTIMQAKEAGNMEELDVDADIEKLLDINEKHIKKAKESSGKTKKIANENKKLDFDENSDVVEENNIDVNETNKEYKQLIQEFINNVAGSSSTVNQSSEVDADLLADQGNPEVAFDGEVTLDKTFKLKGKSNLPKGSVLKMETSVYGEENPYFKGDLKVKENGDFATEADIEDNALNGELLKISLSYSPESTENEADQAIYGEKGKNLRGQFVHAYTSIKRTRHGAFTYGYLKLKKGEKAQLEPAEWGEKPDDYGDPHVWMKKVSIDKHDKYYDISMKSNLQELTYIRAKIDVPGYQTTGLDSTTKVLPDGSFHFQIPCPEKEGKKISVVIKAYSDFAIDTEKTYGEYGEKFKGDLTKKTKRGKKIEYKLPLK